MEKPYNFSHTEERKSQMSTSNDDRWFYSFDGDQVGRRVQTLILENDVPGLVHLSRTVSSAVKTLRDELNGMGCEVLFAAGDSVMAVGPGRLALETLPIAENGLTFSVGVGRTPRAALIALAKAKTKGRGEIVRCEEL
ncbi:MAG: mCpol domain-containing protein [Desulfobulbus sp.]